MPGPTECDRETALAIGKDAVPGSHRARRHSLASCLFLLLALFALATPIPSASNGPPQSTGSIDLTEFEPSFREDFDDLDVSEWGCLSRWTTHTPWDGDFGNAEFDGPQGDVPFAVEDGILTITIRKDEAGTWRSGMLSSWNRCNAGFAQRHGYFEIRARMPVGAGFWPAFWLIGVDRRDGTAEIDIVEYYGHRPDRYSLAVHNHRLKEGQEKIWRWSRNSVPRGSLAQRFHTFGAEITENEVIFYFERKEIWRTRAPPQFRQPMYLLVSLALQDHRINDDTPDEGQMEIDYIHAYQRKPLGI